MTELIDKVAQIGEIISEIELEDPIVAAILTEGYGLSLNLIKVLMEGKNRTKVDISEHLQIINKVLGISLEDVVAHILQSQDPINSSKTPDQETLEFITSDLDDYEKFLAKNKSKENLDFLSKNI